jgi:hypothetical protein
MRRIFNGSGYFEMTRKGEIEAKVTRDKHPPWIAAWVPFCTYSQEVSYRRKDGCEVARVHQYLRPDGTLGASGLPDPKRLLMGDVKYRLLSRPTSRPNWLRALECPFWWVVNRVLSWRY